MEILSKVIELRRNRNTRQKVITLSDEAVEYAKADIKFLEQDLNYSGPKNIPFAVYIEMLIHIMYNNMKSEREGESK